MAVAYLQEFKIVDGDTSTTNYDGVVEKMKLTTTPDGLIVHTAGFDHDGGVFRILDVWETREQGDRFISEQLNQSSTRSWPPTPTRKASPRPTARPGTSFTTP